MSVALRKKYLIYVWVALSVAYSMSCSTTEVAPPKPPTPPVYTQVPHPLGTDLGDLSAIFLDPKAPKEVEFSKTCDGNFKKLKSLTESADEINQGVRELVISDPVYYHWCFYKKLYDVELYLKSEAFVDEKQKMVLENYEFLVPVARSFSSEFHDSRYLRWAVARYQRLSEWVFFRKMDLTPAGTVELVQPSNPFGLYRSGPGSQAILEKYHLGSKAPETSEILPLPSTSPDLKRDPAAQQTAEIIPTDIPSPAPEPKSEK